MYIGKLGDGSAFDDGIYVLLKEVMDNSIDEFMMGEGNKIDITVKDGKVDPGESPKAAAERELMEETGYRAEIMEPWFEYEPDLNIDWTVFVYIARNIEKVAEQNLEGGEKITPKLFSFDKFIEFAVTDNFKATQIKIKVLEAKLDPEKMTELKKLLTIGK
jgi:ADP-ribose pyrophosphatase YjhB (NUDIX family)